MDELNLHVERLDHLGIVASTIKDLDLVNQIDSKIPTSKQEKISTGEAVAAMILNGLGFTSEPLYLSPEFFEDKALSNLFGRDDLEAKNFNARKLSSSLDDLYNYDLEKLFFELAISSCKLEEVDITFKSLDTTSISLTGNYDSSCDEHEIKVTHGFSKDKRQDLKQIVHELLVSQDGGIPLMSRSWDGNKSDVKIFQNRAQELLKQVDTETFDNYLVADSKLYNRDNSINLSGLQFITRIPNIINKTIGVIDASIAKNQWIEIDDKNKYHVTKISHYGIEQRWITVYSKAANSRACKSVVKKIKVEQDTLKKKINKINKDKFTCETDIIVAFKDAIKNLQFHKISHEIKKVKLKNSTADSSRYEVEYVLTESLESQKTYIERKSCYVIGSNISANKLEAKDIINRYKMQNKSIENMGFRFLKDPSLFASSLFVKLPRRIESLLFIMTLALLVYSIAQRKLRNSLEKSNTTLPNQLKKETKIPTLKWVFKLLKGINVVYLTVGNELRKVINGMNEIKTRIIETFGISARKIYGFQT